MADCSKSKDRDNSSSDKYYDGVLLEKRQLNQVSSCCLTDWSKVLKSSRRKIVVDRDDVIFGGFRPYIPDGSTPAFTWYFNNRITIKSKPQDCDDIKFKMILEFSYAVPDKSAASLVNIEEFEANGFNIVNQKYEFISNQGGPGRTLRGELDISAKPNASSDFSFIFQIIATVSPGPGIQTVEIDFECGEIEITNNPQRYFLI
jgi:hypothetical protein